MEEKTRTYIMMGAIAVLSLFVAFTIGTMNGKVVDNSNAASNTQSGETYNEMMARMHSNQNTNNRVTGNAAFVQPGETYNEMMARMHPDQKSSSSTPTASKTSVDLSKYRQAPIPEDCRLADYDDDIKAWAKHLSHHANTQYCLEYYKDIN